MSVLARKMLQDDFVRSSNQNDIRSLGELSNLAPASRQILGRGCHMTFNSI
jgi:hypothetical protein